MAAINALLDELRFETLKVALLNAFLDATALFLLLLLLLSVFSMGILIPLLAALIFFGVDVWRQMRKVSLRYIEERNPSIREMLRTAADNKDSENLMAHALFTELLGKMHEVSGGTLLDFRKITIRLGALFALSLILVSLAFFNVNIQKFENPLAQVGDTLSSYWNGLIGSPNETTSNVSLADDSLYGDPSLAKLGNEALGIQLQQNLNQIDFNTVSAADQASGSLQGYPVNVSAQASTAYTGGLTDVNDRKTAAEYSQQVKQ